MADMIPYIIYTHSNTTKGNMKSILRYDSDQLIRGIRTSAEISYITEQALGQFTPQAKRILLEMDAHRIGC